MSSYSLGLVHERQQVVLLALFVAVPLVDGELVHDVGDLLALPRLGLQVDLDGGLVLGRLH